MCLWGWGLRSRPEVGGTADRGDPEPQTAMVKGHRCRPPALEALWGVKQSEILAPGASLAELGVGEGAPSKRPEAWPLTTRPQDPDVQGTVPQAQGTAPQDP